MCVDEAVLEQDADGAPAISRDSSDDMDGSDAAGDAPGDTAPIAADASAIDVGDAVVMAYDGKTRAMCVPQVGLRTYTGFVAALQPNSQCECWFHEDNSTAVVSRSLAAQCRMATNPQSSVVTPACEHTRLLMAGCHKLWGSSMPPCILDMEDGTGRCAQFMVLDVKRTAGAARSGATANGSLDLNGAATVSFYSGGAAQGHHGLAECSMCNSQLERATAQMQLGPGGKPVAQTCPHTQALRHLYREHHHTPDMVDAAVDHTLASTACRLSRGSPPGELCVLPTSDEVHFAMCQVSRAGYRRAPCEYRFWRCQLGLPVV